MRTPITYYGGKQRMVPMLLKILPPHKIYCEPFFGGGALFWGKEPSYLETINDSNKNVVNFLEVLQNNFEALKNRVDNTLFSETLFWDAYRIYCHPKRVSRVDRAWAFWMISNFSFAAKIGGGIKFSNGTNGTHPGRLLDRKKHEFTDRLMERLKFVHISCRDVLTVIDNRDTSDALFYLDPPYVGADMGHYKGYSQEDFDKLLDKLSTIQGKFILSSYPNDSLTTFVQENNWNHTSLNMRLSAGHHSFGHRRKTECITTNFNNYDLFSEL